jgi:hypothetical protein
MKVLKSVVSLLFVSALFSSCSKNEPVKVENDGNYIVAVTPAASTGVADYLLTAKSLDEGSISTAGNGVEQDGTYRYYLTANKKFFSFLYGQGNPGAVTTYNILGGKLNKLSNFQTETVQAFTPVNEDILLMKISRNITNPFTNFYRVNTNSLTIVGEGQIKTDVLTPGDEFGHFSWIKQIGNKVYAPYFSIQGGSYATAFPDQAWVAVYSYPELKLEKIIEDDRTSFIGRYFIDGLDIVENGDIYAFSASIATDGTKVNDVVKMTSTKPSAITRIKAGTTEFDKSYFFNFEEVSGENNITTWFYVGNNNFIVFSTNKSEKGQYVTGKRVGVVNVVNKTYKEVKGIPAVSDIKSLTARSNYSNKNGIGYIGVNLNSGISYVYKIDAQSATATQGLKVEGGVITAIEHLD